MGDVQDFLWVGAALVAGIAIRAVLRRRHADDDSNTLSASDFVTALSTVAILLVAFIMVAAFDSWSEAGQVATEESEQVVTMSRHARFLEPEEGEQLVGGLVCYARSVVNFEWDTMTDRKESTVTKHWLATFNTVVESNTNAGSEDEQFVDLEASLYAERERRLGDALPSVPTVMWIFMVVTVMLTVFSLGFCTTLTRGGAANVVLVVASAAILAGSLALVRDLDSPYSGISSQEPTAMRSAQEVLLREFKNYEDAELPCNSQGLPSGFEAKAVEID